MKRAMFVAALMGWALCAGTGAATAGDEFQEAIQQTEDEWQAVRETLEQGQKTLDDLQKKYREYRDAAFSDSPEKGLELARIIFKLDKNQTGAAEAKVKAMRDMFRELDRSGLADKLETASQYLGKANDFAGEVNGIWEFTKKFNPDHAKDNPTYGLRLIGTLLSESAAKMETIPLVGQVLGKWVKAYGEVAGDFANALDRLNKKIDDFRGGSLCGQLGMRQDQQAAFKKAGGTDCLTHFASGIFPRLRGETYEGETDYFLYDPATGRGYIASKQADTVYLWHSLLLEPRALDPDWLAGRANSLKPEVISRARDAYRLFRGWYDQTETDWVILDKLGLYQDAYLYGQLDEPAFLGNYILADKHHKAIDAILREYEKYIVISGTIREEVEDRERRAAGVLVEFTVGDKQADQTTGNDGRYEVLIQARVDDQVRGRISKSGFETIDETGRIPQKAVTGLNYTMIADSGTADSGTDAGPGPGLEFGDENLGFQIEALVIEPAVASSYTGTRYAVGDPIHLRIDVTGARAGPATPLTTEWLITMPDERQLNTQSSRLLAAEGVSGAMTWNIRTDEGLPLGLYRVVAVISLNDREVARRSGSFELLPLFETPEILITDAEESTESLSVFRPADPLYVLAKMTYNSVDPERQVHLSVVLDGPDPGIAALGVEADQTFYPGPMLTGMSQRVPEMIQEGQYTATVTLDGGFNQRLSFRETFQIIYPVKFEGIWSLNGLTPPEVKTRFTGNEPFEWFMRYTFTDARPGDRYSSALWCHWDEIVLNELSSEKLGPDSPNPGTATTSFTGVIPVEMPAATYEVNGVVWYNEVAYPSPGTTIKIGQEPTITITSPQTGFNVDQKVLVVTGTCADKELTKAWLSSNGESIPIKLAQGEFSAKTVLRPGQNQIVVTAENDLGTSEDYVTGFADIQAAVLKVVLSWEAQGTDIDLWVTDPQGVVTNYQKKKPAEGRQLDVDDQSGPGMETYTVEVPLRGNYGIAVHYYGAGGWQGSVPFNLQVTTWETTFNETRQTLGGTLYKAAGNKDEPGAVEYFTVQVY